MACAMGAAIIAEVGYDKAVKLVDKNDFSITPKLVEKFWKWATKLKIKDCPVEMCEDWAGPVVDFKKSTAITAENMIYHLNDDHKWTFNQIADWVQIQEAVNGLGEQAKGATVRSTIKSTEPANAG